ncbi:uncharacterized protein LOC110698741 [Chenopodium quinoa]|uniref:uncharacterized protein LOC110698741 n=1 Tax=Chenopodium quinoa TaxID=63459 RepID=UPI000B7866A6|nr:uncharacterized protein LOC110698741 [Chenopodium quinoa]
MDTDRVPHRHGPFGGGHANFVFPSNHTTQLLKPYCSISLVSQTPTTAILSLTATQIVADCRRSPPAGRRSSPLTPVSQVSFSVLSFSNLTETPFNPLPSLVATSHRRSSPSLVTPTSQLFAAVLGGPLTVVAVARHLPLLVIAVALRYGDMKTYLFA